MRITGIDFHPTEPWVLGTTYSGCVYIWNVISKEVVKFFKISEVAVRAGRFIARKNWIIVACDDARLYVFNIESMDLIKVIPHSDLIREVIVHPEKPWVMVGSDDHNIHLFDWDNDWKSELALVGHKGSVTSLVVNPQIPSIIVSGSSDGTVQEWNFAEQTQSIIRVTHTQGVSWVGYQNKNPPQLISASDDGTIKVMKEEGGFGLKGTTVAFYNPLSLVVTGSKEGVLRLYSSTETGYNFEKAFALEGPIWAIGNDNFSKMAFGNDSGLFILEVLNTVDGLDVKTEMLPFKGDNEVEQFSTSIIRGDKFAPALDGVMDQQEFSKCVAQINGNTKNNVKTVLKSALPAGGAFYFLSFFMPLILIVFVSVLASGVAAAKFKNQKKALKLPTQANVIEEVNKNLSDRNISFKNEGNQMSVYVKKRGALAEPEEVLYIEAPPADKNSTPSSSFSTSISSISSSVSSIASSIPAAVSALPSSLSSIPSSIQDSIPSIPTISASLSSIPSTISNLPTTIPSSIASIQYSIPSIPTISSSISSIPSSIATSISSLTATPPPSLSSSDFPQSSSISTSPKILYSNVHHNVAIPAHSSPASLPSIDSTNEKSALLDMTDI